MLKAREAEIFDFFLKIMPNVGQFSPILRNDFQKDKETIRGLQALHIPKTSNLGKFQVNILAQIIHLPEIPFNSTLHTNLYISKIQN